jgi:hypothetical protein
MLVALIVAMPIGVAEVVPVLGEPQLILAGIGVGVSSSVIPYICDQLAMARLPRATFALMLPAARDRLHRRRRSPRSSADLGRNRRYPARRDGSGRS